MPSEPVVGFEWLLLRDGPAQVATRQISFGRAYIPACMVAISYNELRWADVTLDWSR